MAKTDPTALTLHARTTRNVRLFRRWYTGETYRTLAKEYGCAPRTMKDWVLDGRLVYAVRLSNRAERKRKKNQ